MTSSTGVNAGYWYWKGELQPDSIDSSLFTHLFTAFADVNPGTYNLRFPPGYETQFQSFAKTVKSINSDVKAILSIGGDTDPSIFATIASDSNYRKTFIGSSIDVARDFNYDGLSLNWLYPDQTTNLVTLLKEWRATLNDKAPKLLLTVAVSDNPEDYPIQDIEDIVNSLDWFNVVAYDLKAPVTSPNSILPLAPFLNPLPSALILSVAQVIDFWISKGVPVNKLVIGLPFHGRSWLLQNAHNHEIFSDASGAATEVSDPILYRQIQEHIKTERGVEVIDHNYVAQYWYFGTTWSGYDGKDIISDKVTYVKQNKLLGYFAWHVDGDDSDWALSNQGNY
ncbi:class V chitinase-like [Corylus avellana]|uniref:class V chitinase-like n=1 Tax=Corylus avellana TaxID=13451 RepID=UPI00286ACA1B|nr:class V chitinase-like [Corylus avellana]